MAQLTRRMQIMLDDERYERLRRQADQAGTSIGAVIREAIDRLFSSEAERRFRAGQVLLAAEPMPVDDWPVMKREIEEMYERSIDLESDE